MIWVFCSVPGRQTLRCALQHKYVWLILCGLKMLQNS